MVGQAGGMHAMADIMSFDLFPYLVRKCVCTVTSTLAAVTWQ